MDYKIEGIQDSGTRTLAKCVPCNYESKNVSNLKFNFCSKKKITFVISKIAGTSADGTALGKCPMNPSGLLCHSDGHCNVCRLFIVNNVSVHVGCTNSSSTPICDADSTVIGVQDSAVDKRAICAGCKKSGKSGDISIAIVLYFERWKL